MARTQFFHCGGPGLTPGRKLAAAGELRSHKSCGAAKNNKKHLMHGTLKKKKRVLFGIGTDLVPGALGFQQSFSSRDAACMASLCHGYCIEKGWLAPKKPQVGPRPHLAPTFPQGCLSDQCFPRLWPLTLPATRSSCLGRVAWARQHWWPSWLAWRCPWCTTRPLVSPSEEAFPGVEKRLALDHMSRNL